MFNVHENTKVPRKSAAALSIGLALCLPICVWAEGESLPVTIFVDQDQLQIDLDEKELRDYRISRQLFQLGHPVDKEPVPVEISLEGRVNDQGKIYFPEWKAPLMQHKEGLYSEKLMIEAYTKDHRKEDRPLQFQHWIYYSIDNGEVRHIDARTYSDKTAPIHYEIEQDNQRVAVKLGQSLAMKLELPKGERAFDKQLDAKRPTSDTFDLSEKEEK